jgi:ferritin-like metal-binding protein YciE
MNSLLELLQEQVRDLYDAETQYRFKLPDMMDRATHSGLRECLLDILDDASWKIAQLEKVCEGLDVPPHGVACEAMKGLIRETAETTREHGDSATIDANLIANAQRIVHYEIAGLGTARAFAACQGRRDLAAILAELTALSGKHDRTLTQIATGGWFGDGINAEAVKNAA